MFACGYSGVRVAAFFEKLAHFLAFVVKVGVVTAEASQSEKLREWDGIKLSINDNGLSTSVHYKPTDSHNYLLHSSSHPQHVKNVYS